MLGLLGALLVKLNREARRSTLLQQAIALAPTFAKPHEDLGYLLVQQNRAADAVPYLQRATQLDPKLEKALVHARQGAAVLGRGAEADQAFEKCFELSPERRMMAHAAEHQKEGVSSEAERLYRRVLRHNPRNVDAMRLLSLIAWKPGRDGEAESLLQKAIALAPDFLAAMLDLGKLRKEQDRYGEVARVLRSCARARSGERADAFPARARRLRLPRSRTKRSRRMANASSCGPDTSAHRSVSVTCTRPWAVTRMRWPPTMRASGCGPISARPTGVSRT